MQIHDDNNNNGINDINNDNGINNGNAKNNNCNNEMTATTRWRQQQQQQDDDNNSNNKMTTTTMTTTSSTWWRQCQQRQLQHAQTTTTPTTATTTKLMPAKNFVWKSEKLLLHRIGRLSSKPLKQIKVVTGWIVETNEKKFKKHFSQQFLFQAAEQELLCKCNKKTLADACEHPLHFMPSHNLNPANKKFRWNLELYTSN